MKSMSLKIENNYIKLMCIMLIQSIFALFSVYASATLDGHKNSSYSTSMNNNYMEKITLYYYEYFKYKKKYNLENTPECKTYPLKLVTKSPEEKYIIRCRQEVELLRPERIAEKWKTEEKKNGYILFKAGTTEKATIHAYIESIKISDFSISKVLKSAVFQPVTGVFKRYTFNAVRYTFKNLATGTISQINATTNHPFYVVNKKKFIPISMISPKDILLSATGRRFALICHKKNAHCGLPFSDTKPILVYNLESYKKHIYFAGSAHMTVHNCSVPIYDARNFLSQYSPPTKEQLVASEARDILVNAHAMKSEKETLFILSYGASVRKESPLSSYFKLFTVDDFHDLVNEIAPDGGYEHVCVIHCAPQRYLHSYEQYFHRAEKYFQQLADKLNKSVTYNTEGSIAFKYHEIQNSEKIYQRKRESYKLIHDLESKQYFRTVHPHLKAR